MKRRPVLQCFAAGLLVTALCYAQIPRFHKPDGTARKVLNLLQAQQYMSLAAFTRVKTIDANGNGDFSTISSAMTWAAALGACPSTPPFPTDCRSGFSRYLFLVYPGDGTNNSAVDGYNFTETSFAVPDYVVLQGVASPWAPAGNYSGTPVVAMTGPTGCLLTLGTGAAGQSALVNLTFKVTSRTLTGNTQLMCVSAGTNTATNVNLFGVNITDSTFGLDLLSVSGGALYGFNLNTSRQGTTPGTLSRNIVTTGSGNVILFGGRHQPRPNQLKTIENAGTGTVRLLEVTVDAGATSASLANTSTGPFQVFSTPYDTSSGTITDEVIRANSVTLTSGAKVLSGAGAPEGAVTAAVGSLWLRSDGGTSTSLCVKETGAGNTGWACK